MFHPQAVRLRSPKRQKAKRTTKNKESFGRASSARWRAARLEATLLLGGLSGLVDEGLVDVGDDTTTGDGGLDEGVELLVTTDGELEMAGRDTLDLEVLAGVAGELEDLGGQVLKDGGRVDGGGGTDTLGLLDGGLKETVDTTDGELSRLLVFGIFKRYGYGGDEKGDETSRERGYRYHMFSGVPLVGIGRKIIIMSTKRARNQNQRSNFEVSSGSFDSPEVQPWTNATGAPSWRWGPFRPFLPYLLCLLCRTVNRDGNVEERE